MSERIKGHCPSCGRAVASVQIDETSERVFVDGPMLAVAFQIPGLAGYTTGTAERLHRCRRPRRRP